MRTVSAVKGIVLLFVFSAFLNAPYIHVREFQGEEGTRVNVARNMLASGDWIVPRLEGKVYLNKPPLYNWMLAGVFAAAGRASEAAARLPSAVLAFLTAAALSLFWRRIADVRSMWFILPGVVFLTFPDVIDKAVRAEIDLAFTCFITLSYLAWFFFHEDRDQPFAAWGTALFLIGISVLTKGVQAPAFFYCGVVPYLIYRRETRKLFSLEHLGGIIIGALVVMLWVVPLVGNVGVSRFADTWIHEILVRKEGLKEGGFFRHFAEFPFQYAMAYMPWIVFGGLWFRKPSAEPSPVIRKLALFCVLCMVFSIPFYWLVPGARLRYILPLSGMLALLLTIPLHALIQERISEPSWVRWFLAFLGAVAGLAVLAAPLWARKFTVLERPVAIAALAGACLAGILLTVRKDHVGRRIMLVIVMALFGKIAWASLYFPYHAERHSHYRTAVRAVEKFLPPGATLYDHGYFNAHFAYYLNRPLRYLSALDASTLERGAVVMIKGDVPDGFDHDSFSFLGEVNIRHATLRFFRYEALPGQKPGIMEHKGDR